MIFNSQSAITDRTREAAWSRWYEEHLHIMSTVPGVFSAQRFLTTHPNHSPSLAMYGVRDAEVFQGEYYLRVRGMGEWLPLIDKRWYKRNLFDGLDIAPLVNEDQVLLVADRDAVDATLAPFAWLKAAGIDRSTPYRGLAVVHQNALPALPADVAVYTPASKRHAR
ncbi:MAG: hypothetical protein FJY56_21840 [Betaproteobacteria bacterium]|nr:hypothetical protein [Betaproteobacteria bacterium]